jgi:hypothetical protein
MSKPWIGIHGTQQFDNSSGLLEFGKAEQGYCC